MAKGEINILTGLNTFSGFRYIRVALTGIVIFGLAYFLAYFHTNRAPDIFTDEILYTRIGIRVAGEGALVWDSGEPFLVHPPLYFLISGVFETLTGNPDTPLYGAGDIFENVYHTRALNALLAGATALILYAFGGLLHKEWLGILYAGLFMLDPFGLRINRRAMLETLAMLMALSALLVYWYDFRRVSAKVHKPLVSPAAIFAGLLLGGAALAKEITLIFSLVFVVFSIWEIWRSGLFASRIDPRSSFRARFEGILWIIGRTTLVISIAMMTYGIYIAWVFSTGNGLIFREEKLLGILRLVGLVQITGWNRPGISLVSLLLERLGQYGTSYFVIALGGISLIGLIIWRRRQLASRFLISIGLVFYPFFAFIALFGSGNDQFFYFLLPPAIMILGFAAAQASEVLLNHAGIDSPRRILARIGTVAVGAVLCLTLIYNFSHWWTHYATGADNGYAQFTNFVRTNIPPGEMINASGDPIKLRYFLPEYTIVPAATPEEAMAAGVRYFALAPKDVLMRYGRITPELADWIISQGKLLYSVNGLSYGDIFLYHLEYNSTSPVSQTVTKQHQLQGSLFQAARGGHTNSLLFLLGLWVTICITLAALLAWGEGFIRNEKNWFRRTLYQ